MKRTRASSELVYVNKSTNAEMVSREGRITEANNADAIRATVGEMVCGSESRIPDRRLYARVVETPNPMSFDRRVDEREL